MIRSKWRDLLYQPTRSTGEDEADEEKVRVQHSWRVVIVLVSAMARKGGLDTGLELGLAGAAV